VAVGAEPRVLDVPLPGTFAELQASEAAMAYLPRHRFRAEYSLRKLAEVGFENVELVEGIDGFRGDVFDVAEDMGWVMNPELGPGKVGCALTMLHLWTRIVDEERPYLVIFEDDVLPHPMVPDLGPVYWHDTPPDVQWVYLGNQMWVPPPLSRRSVVRVPAFCSHAYVVTQEGAAAGLDRLRRGPAAPDRTVHAIDIEVIEWMRAGTISYACWNGTRLPKAFVTSQEVGDDPSTWPADVVWADRDSGVFYQNFALGSTIHGEGIVLG
jgi:hypothetical protein